MGTKYLNGFMGGHSHSNHCTHPNFNIVFKAYQMVKWDAKDARKRKIAKFG